MCGDQSPVRKMIDTYHKRRDILVEGLNSIPKLHCLCPEGAFYVFPDIRKTGMTSREFAKRALEEANVGLLPGSDFGPSGEGFVRLCYATSEKNILEGIERLRKLVEA